MQRKNRNKLRLIGLLMIMSLVMLAGFTGKWLTVQYADEKVNLRNNLEQIYARTNDQYIDSMIQIELAGSRHSPMGTAITNMPFTSTAHMTVIDSLSDQKMIHIENNAPMDSMPHNFSMGIKRFLIKIKSPIGTNARSLIDTARLIRRFARNIGKDIPVRLMWVPSSDSGAHIIIPTDTRNNIAADGYQRLLLRKISPQIGFTVLLLLLCSCAFILSYNTVRRQLRLNAQKDNFISNMSHELKTPVATAKVAIEALRSFNALEDPVKTKDYLQMASWEIDRLETLIGNVLNSMQLEAGRVVMKKEPVDIALLLQDLAQGMQPLFNKYGKTIHTSFHTDHVMVHADRIHLQGAFYNMIDNAIKYGGDKTEITLSAQDGRIQVTVSDNGKGIPPEYSRKIFDRFFRIPSGNVHDVKGYGLGLNYTRYVILSHDGDIYQQNNKDGGAEFEISLPMKTQA